MDQYTYNSLPQGSKLMTYMTHNAQQHTEQQQQQQQQQQLHSTPSPSEINEFIPGSYYRSLEMQNEAAGYGTSSMASHLPMHMPIPRPPQVHQENVGGTTYFYSTSGGDGGDGSSGYPMQPYTPSQVYTGTPNYVATLNSKSSLESTFFNADIIRNEVLQRNQLSFIQPEVKNLYPDLPTSVENYCELVPIEMMPLGGTPVISTSYRATSRVTGGLFVLRRLHDFRLASSKCSQLIEKWKKVDHPNLVKLREVFSTKRFGDHSLIFVYDFHPGSVTVMQKYITEGGSGDSIGSNFDNLWTDPDAPRPYTHHKNTLLRAVYGGNMLPEATIWSLLTQLTAALRIIHLAGLACRKLDPSKIIVCGYRLRLSWTGCDEIASTASGATLPDVESAQQDDLNALGHLILALACKTTRALNPSLAHTYLQLVSKAYSSDLKNVMAYLMSVSPLRSVTDLMPMIGARFYTQIEHLERRSDVLEDQLAKELDNGRLNRLLIKLNTVNERPELGMDCAWSETGDRYMLKLFRDYLFHSVTADGRPWLDLSHIVYTLNMLDAGAERRIELMGRDEQAILIVSFAELKACLERAFNEVYEASACQ